MLFNPCKHILRKGEKQTFGVSSMNRSIETDSYAGVDPGLLPQNDPRYDVRQSVSANVQKQCSRV